MKEIKHFIKQLTTFDLYQEGISRSMKPKKLTQEEQLENLRKQFRYYSDGTPDPHEYGSFKRGMTIEEIDDYLRVFSGKMNITAIRKKFDYQLSGSTCASVTIKKEIICLIYRHDVERFARQAILGTSTYFD